VLSEDGAIPLAIPRDRDGTVEIVLVPKNARRFPTFDQHVLSLYPRGMTTGEIQEHLEEFYQVDVDPQFISAVTNEVLEEVTAGQQRPLESCYPVIIFDALRMKIRDEGTVRNKAVYLALGTTRTGTKDVLGLWIEQTEGAKFWHRVMTEFRAPAVTVLAGTGIARQSCRYPPSQLRNQLASRCFALENHPLNSSRDSRSITKADRRSAEPLARDVASLPSSLEPVLEWSSLVDPKNRFSPVADSGSDDINIIVDARLISRPNEGRGNERSCENGHRRDQHPDGNARFRRSVRTAHETTRPELVVTSRRIVSVLATPNE
jgi:hypothetical protein